LLGLIKPSNGLISIGSLNPTEFISEFPGAIAYVSQDHTLSAGTLRSCILGPYTSEEVTDSEIVETLKKVSMHSLVRDLKDGLDHKIKDDGNNLSGGQIQRISIARALITKPKILVLDEATSNLDQGTQREIVEELSNLKGTCTVIVVAHRLEVLEHMDRILVLGSQEPPNAIKRESQSV
jgi:ATP-binding cassette subfamily C protein